MSDELADLMLRGDDANDDLEVLEEGPLQAEDGPTALALVAETERSIELLVTDVVMPHMTGKELADRLRTQRPALLVLFVSGYTENTIVHHGVLEDVEFLAKPFSRAELLDRVGQLLEDPRG